MVSRRGLMAAGLSGGAVLIGKAGAGTAEAGEAVINPAADLKPMTGGVKPISVEERRGRIAKAQTLMGQAKIGAVLLEPGAAMDYFTGIQWWRSERLTAVVIPARGDVTVITPAFEEPSVRETLAVGDDVRPWNEHESPFALVVQALKDRGVTGPLAVEGTVRFFVVDNIRKLSPALEIVSAHAVTRACRMIKSPAELALMQAATDVTMAAYAYVHARVKTGMTPEVIAEMMNEATVALGGAPEFSMVLLNEAAAFPHGSSQPQTVKAGGVVLMDCGCTVHGYQSDISRTWVNGEPSPRQRKVWETIKRGQEIALETAKVGVACGQVDRAVRAFYEKEGWGPGYKLPGLSHRTGHGIGMEGHEPAFLVSSDETLLAPGMCFSDEPGIYIPGEFGMRLEDCFHMTETGPKLFSGLAKSLEEPI
jgi:Xaa-Pro dipeptidase